MIAELFIVLGVPAIIATIVASKKGFADGRWFLTFGVIGLIVVCCLPSARKGGITGSEARRRAHNADVTGKILCVINVAVIVILVIAHFYLRSAVGHPRVH